jgi:hypothetical protein
VRANFCKALLLASGNKGSTTNDRLKKEDQHLRDDRDIVIAGPARGVQRDEWFRFLINNGMPQISFAQWSFCHT